METVLSVVIAGVSIFAIILIICFFFRIFGWSSYKLFSAIRRLFSKKDTE